jgi:hypothetical protein
VIYINGQQIENIYGVSNRFQAILSMIPGGMSWFKWVAAANTPPVYATDENQLLRLTLEGLHTNGYICFNFFRAHIDKILSMPALDVEQLSAAGTNATGTEPNIAAVMKNNNLLTYSDLGGVNDFITSASLSGSPLFQMPSFSDLLALSVFVKQTASVKPGIKTQALSFAQNNAATVDEFIDLFFFYTFTAQNLLKGNLSAAAQNSEVQALYNQLLPITYFLLFTPNLGAGNTEPAIKQALQEQARVSNFIGYDTSPAAALNLVQNINPVNQPEASLQTQTESYLATIKNLVSFTAAGPGTISQDGRLTTFRVENEQALALVGVDAPGNIVLLPGTKLKTTS